jgi:phospholipid/cholesterol/gamma-HCH transport system substrate-binding protein
MSHEVRIGILALVATGLTLWGIKFIQGTNLLSKTDTYYAYYDEVNGVQIGTPIQISGVTVGSVSAIDLGIEDRRVRLSFTLERKVPMPKSTRAVLMQTSVLGDKAIILDYDQPCQGANCAVDGDELTGVSLDMVESILGEGGIGNYMEQLTASLNQLVDSINYKLLGDDSEGPLAESARGIQSTVENLKQATGRMNLMLQRSAPALESTLNNVDQLTATLEQQRGSIAGILDNADSLSNQLVEAQLGEAIEGIKGTITQLNETLAGADQTVAGLNEVMGKIEKGEGTLGMLVQDETLYQNLNALSYSLDSLTTDFQERPYRYLPLKGRNRVKRYDRKDAARDE